MVEHPNIPPNQQNTNENNGEEDIIEFELNELDIEDNSYPESEEFESIDNQLDQLNTALDEIEQKNDNILAELTALLNENRQIRQQLQQCRVEEIKYEELKNSTTTNENVQN